MGIKVDTQSIENSNNSCLGITKNYIVRSTSWIYGYSYKMPILLSSEIELSMANIDWQHGCSGNLNNLFFIGENYDSYNLYLEKYNEDSSLEWSIVVDDSPNSPDFGMIAAYPF